MNKGRFILVLTIFLLGTCGMSAQLSNVQRGQRGYTPTARPYGQYDGEKTDPYEILSERIPVFTETFGLDTFESEVLKSILLTSYERMAAISDDPKLKFTDKQELIMAEDAILRKELNVILSEEQINTLMVMDFSEKSKKKKKKKKKGKKSKS